MHQRNKQFTTTKKHTNPRLKQQPHVDIEVVDDIQPLKCMLAWRKCSNIGLCEPKRTKFHSVAHKFFHVVVDHGQTEKKL